MPPLHPPPPTQKKCSPTKDANKKISLLMKWLKSISAFLFTCHLRQSVKKSIALAEKKGRNPSFNNFLFQLYLQRGGRCELKCLYVLPHRRHHSLINMQFTKTRFKTNVCITCIQYTFVLRNIKKYSAKKGGGAGGNHATVR